MPTINSFNMGHTSARSRTKAKDIGASGIFHTSTKLSGYVWLGSDTKAVHVPEDQAGDVQMDADDDAADDETNDFQSYRSRFNKMMKFMKKFLMNRWKVYALKKERKHKSKQDTLNRQRNLACLQHVILWSAMAITLCLNFQLRTMRRSGSGCSI